MLDTLHCKLHATKSPVYYDEASFAFLVSEGKTTDQRVGTQTLHLVCESANDRV